MKKFLASLMLLVLFSPFALRADEIIVGNGTGSSSASPFGNSWDYSWMEMIYQSSDIGQACTITSLSYNCANPYQYNYIANEIKIYLAEVTKTEMTLGEFTPESELTLVYQGSDVVLGEEEWETINLSTPFEYSGVNNLVIVISKSADYFQPNLKWMNNNVAKSIMFAYSDYDPSAAQFPTGTSYVYGFLPNVKLGIGAGSTPDPTIPAAPANFNATATGQTTIALTWDAVAGATSYNVYNGTTSVATGLTTTSYTVENLTANTEYCYTVTAVNAVGESEASDEDCATTDAENTDDEEEIVLLSDNFNDNNIDGWRTFQGDNDSYNWTIKTSGGIDNSSYIQSLSYVSGANINTDNYIVTTSQYYINASTEFSFYTCPKSSGYPYENFSVVISEDGENWIAVYTEMFDENTPTEFTKRTVALSSHAGKNVYIGLRHHDCDLDWCSGINVDNIMLTTLDNSNQPTIPAAPTNLTATATETTITLTWDAVIGATSYNIYSGTTNVATGLTTTSYTVENLTANTEYCYTITAVNAAGESTASEEICITTEAEEVTPQETEGDTWQNAIEVAAYPFNHTPDFANLNNDYTLPGETQDGADVVYKLTFTEETTFSASVTGANGKLALYAEDFNGEDGPGADNYYGAENNDDPVDPTIPAAPANLNATATGQTTISLTWDAVNGATSYNIYSGTTNVAIGLTTTSYTVENLTANTEYCYTVTAVNAVGESEASDEDCATTDAENTNDPSTLLYDNFNDNNIDGWRTFQGDDDSYNWTIKTSGGIDNSSYIQSLSYVSGANINTDNYIVTTSQYYINASTEFSFYTCPKSSGYPYENFSVVISEDGENWIAVYTEMFDENTPTEFTKRTVALSSHAGKNVYIGLRHHDCDLEWCSGINVDNIELSNGSKRYVRNSMENITVPAGTYYLVASATEAFSVSINIDGNEEDPELLPVAEVIATENDENVDITWSMETNTREYEFHSYKLFRAFGENEPIVLAENIAATTSSFQDDTWATAEAGAYKWGVAVMYTNTTSRDDAELLASEIVWSNIINKEDEEEPFEIVAPYDLTGEATYNDEGTYGVKLEWVIPYCVYDHFNIYRRVAGGTYEKIAETESLTYYDDVNADGTYYYQVTSFAEVDGVEYESEPATAADGSGQDFVEITLTSIEENGVQGLTIYPNPTKNNINITAENMTRITVTNALGQVMYNQEVVSDNEIINMAQYEAGVYMVRIVTENGVAVERITVVR